MSELLRVACLQMNSSSSVSENLDFVAQQMGLAKQQGVKLLLLPENFAQMPATSAQRYIESDQGGTVSEFLAGQAKSHQMMVIAGSLPVTKIDTDKPFARSLVFGANGDLIKTYDKIHLYDVDLADGQQYRESAVYKAGSAQTNSPNLAILETKEETLVEPKLLRLGLTICYDLRFPELYRILSAAGAQVIVAPSAFTQHTGAAHWQTLLQCRALENQVFMLAAAQVGIHQNQRETWGHTMVVDPWGDVIAELPTATGLLIADLDLIKQVDLRQNFPVLQHRRLD